MAGTLRSIIFTTIPIANIVSGAAEKCGRARVTRIVCSKIQALFARRTGRSLRKRVITINLFYRLCFGKLRGRRTNLGDVLEDVRVPLALSSLNVSSGRRGLSTLRHCVTNSHRFGDRSPVTEGELRYTVLRVV